MWHAGKERFNRMPIFIPTNYKITWNFFEFCFEFWPLQQFPTRYKLMVAIKYGRLLIHNAFGVTKCAVCVRTLRWVKMKGMRWGVVIGKLFGFKSNKSRSTLTGGAGKMSHFLDRPIIHALNKVVPSGFLAIAFVVMNYFCKCLPLDCILFCYFNCTSKGNGREWKIFMRNTNVKLEIFQLFKLADDFPRLFPLIRSFRWTYRLQS